MTELATPLDALPDDRREAVPQDLHGSYRRLDQSLQQIHVDATYDVAVALGAALTTSARLGTVVGACATDTNTSNDATCLDAFIKKFGARALRRPLAADEVDFYKTAYGTSTTAVGRRVRRSDRPVRHRARVHVLRRARRQRGRRPDRRLRRLALRAGVAPLVPAVADGARRRAAGRGRRRQPAAPPRSTARR